MKKLTDQQLKNAVESFATFAGAEDAKLVIEILSENAGLLEAYAEQAKKQGVASVAEATSALASIDRKTCTFLAHALEEIKKRAVADTFKDDAGTAGAEYTVEYRAASWSGDGFVEYVRTQDEKEARDIFAGNWSVGYIVRLRKRTVGGWELVDSKDWTAREPDETEGGAK